MRPGLPRSLLVSSLAKRGRDLAHNPKDTGPQRNAVVRGLPRAIPVPRRQIRVLRLGSSGPPHGALYTAGSSEMQVLQPQPTEALWFFSWRAQQDSNLRPSGPQYETDPRNDAGLRLLPCKGLQGAAPGCTRDGSRLYPAPTFRESPAAPDQPGRDPHPLPLPRPTRARIGGVKIDCETEACPRGAPSAGQCGWSGELPGSSNVPHEKDPQTDEEKEREPVNQEGRPEW